MIGDVSNEVELHMMQIPQKPYQDVCNLISRKFVTMVAWLCMSCQDAQSIDDGVELEVKMNKAHMDV